MDAVDAVDDVEAVDVQDTMDEVKAVVAKGAAETRILFQIPLPQVRFLLTPDQYTGQVSFFKSVSSSRERQ